MSPTQRMYIEPSIHIHAFHGIVLFIFFFLLLPHFRIIFAAFTFACVCRRPKFDCTQYSYYMNAVCVIRDKKHFQMKHYTRMHLDEKKSRCWYDLEIVCTFEKKKMYVMRSVCACMREHDTCICHHFNKIFTISVSKCMERVSFDLISHASSSEKVFRFAISTENSLRGMEYG